MTAIQVGKVGMIQTKDIIIEDRTRKELGDLEGLEDNMKSSGLIAPLAVMDNKDGTYRLLAGERRLTVLLKNNISMVPVRIYENSLSDLEMKIIEKAENFHRKEMAYWEMDALTTEIHKMQQELLGVKAAGPGSEGWGTKDTAQMIGVKSHASISEAIKRHEAREKLPDLFINCRTASDASKIIKKVDETILKKDLAQKIKSSTSNTSFQQLAKCFIIKDAIDGISEIPNEVIHLVEIDPPYAIDLHRKKKSEGESQYISTDYNEVDPDRYKFFLPRILKDCYRVMATHSWLVCWFGPDPWFEQVYQWIIDAGFNGTRLCGIWAKGTPGQTMNPNTRLGASYEMFFYAWKGSPSLNKPGRSNVFSIPPVPPTQKIHPTERPIELMRELYDTFAFSGSRVLIPFLGSGNGILAAHQLGMTAFGFELSKNYKDSYLVKLNSLVKN